VDTEGKLLGHLFDERFDVFKFPLDMKEAEMAIEDLRTLVRISGLDDREILADSLTEILKRARSLRKNLGQFYAGVRDALDRRVHVYCSIRAGTHSHDSTSLLLGRKHALRVIQGASPEPPGRWFRSFWPFSSNEVASAGPTNHAFTNLKIRFQSRLNALPSGRKHHF
jgi:hypothetical protein